MRFPLTTLQCGCPPNSGRTPQAPRAGLLATVARPLRRGVQCQVVGWLALSVVTGCHLSVYATESTLGPVHVTPLATEPASLGAPQLGLADDGGFVVGQARMCTQQTRQVVTEVVQTAYRPNTALVVAGFLAAAVGGISLVAATRAEDPWASPWTYAGGVAVATGTALIIGPLWPKAGARGRAETRQLNRGNSTVACGQAPLGPGHIVLTANGVRLLSAVAEDGRLAVSPFTVVDAYAPQRPAAWRWQGELQTAQGRHPIDTVIDASALAPAAATYLRAASFPSEIRPLERVATVAPPRLTASLRVGEPASVELTLHVRHLTGGPISGLRGVITANAPEIDGRVLYVGQLAPGAEGLAHLVVPVDAAALPQLASEGLRLRVELRDAHGAVHSPSTTLVGPLLRH